MTLSDYLFWAADAIILFRFAVMVKESTAVELESTVGKSLRWIVPALFWGFAIFGWFNYDGIFRLVQTIAMVLMGALYLMMKSGLTPEGIVMMGKFTPYGSCGQLKLNSQDKCLYYSAQNAHELGLFFTEEQLDDVRAYLKAHKVRYTEK